MKYLPGLLLLATVGLGSVAFTSCSEDEDYTISTSPVVSSIVTGDVEATSVSAVVKGSVSDLSKLSTARYQVGAIYGTSQDVTVSGSKVVGSLDEQGNIQTSLTGLTAGATYYYASYVTMQGKLTQFGEVKSFVATDASVATAAATSLTACSAILNGQAKIVAADIPSSVVGFRYAMTEAEVAEGYYVALEEASNSFSYTLKGLLPNTTYYYAAVSSVGSSLMMGEVATFTTGSQEMEYVDMGVSVLWAAYNIGAEAPEELGARGGFGDQTFFNRSQDAGDYTPWSISGEEDMTAGLDIDGLSKIKSAMPTAAQYEELIANTVQTIEEVNGVKGVRFTSENGNSIFMPMAGYRDGENVVMDGAYYWTSDFNAASETLAKSLACKGGDVVVASSPINLALPVRTVRGVEGIYVNNKKLVCADVEGNGNLRIDIFNEWDGSGACGENSPIRTADVVFSKNISVTFQVTGIKQPGEYQAFMVFADGTWTTQNWGYNENGQGSCIVNGDGVYTLTLDGAGEGVGVFAIDIVGLVAAEGSADNLEAKIVLLEADVAKEGVKINYENLVYGDIENNGRLRLEIYNEYGASKESPSVDPASIVCEKNLMVTFKLSGIDDNLKADANAPFVAGLEYSDPSWGVGYWSGLEMGKYEAPVTGDGTYTVWAEFESAANGAVVFCVDIANLMASVVDPSLVKAELVSVVPDAPMNQPINADIVEFQNKDGNGVDGRIEIYNEWGHAASVGPQWYNDKLAFNGMCIVEFSISGIDGNLVADAAGSYEATMSYSDPNWAYQYWGGNAWGNATVTGDGTYQVYAYLNGDCYGAVVWTVELYNLWKDLVDTSKVQVTVNKITTPRVL